MTFPFEPPDRFDKQVEIYQVVGFREDSQDTFWNPLYDSHIHDVFYEMMYNDELTYDERLALQEEIAFYFYEEYGLDFWDLWDWEDFRAWYDAV